MDKTFLYVTILLCTIYLEFGDKMKQISWEIELIRGESNHREMKTLNIHFIQ